MNTIFWHNLIKSFHLNKISAIICAQYSQLNLNVRSQLFYSSVPAESVTIQQSLSVRHSSLCCFMNRNVKSWKQAVFLSELCAMSKVITTVRSTVFRSWHRPTIVLLLVYYRVDNTLFEVSPVRVTVNSMKLVLQRWHVPHVLNLITRTRNAEPDDWKFLWHLYGHC